MAEFYYPPINPIRLVPQIPDNGLYMTKPFDLWDDDCYAQKFITRDATRVQIGTDYTDVYFALYDYRTTLLAKEFTFIKQDIALLNVDYDCYEAVIDFAGVNVGKYYFELSYTDGDGVLQILQSEPIDLQIRHENTLLYEYRNSDNEFSVVFDTGITFALRVEGIIADYTPAFDDTTYIDEVRNTTKLNSVYYDQFKLYAPGISGFIPSWMAKKLNIVMSCDTVKIDGIYYQRAEGSKWEVNRVAERDMMGINIDILPIDNLVVNRIRTGSKLPDNLVVVQKSLPFYNIASDFRINGVFTKYSVTEYLSITNTHNSIFTIKVGTTPGGGDLCIQDIGPEDTAVCDIYNQFYGAENVYISGLSGVSGLSVDIFIVYKQLDAPPVNLPYNVPDQLGKGAVIRYEEVSAGDMLSAFDLNSGLGVKGSKWEKWAIKDSRNGGQDESDCFTVMYNPQNPDYDQIGTTGGASSFQLSIDQLPNFYLKMFGNDYNHNGGDQPNDTQRVAFYRGYKSQALDYEMSRSGVTDNTNMVGRTSDIGSGAVIDKRPKYIVALWVIKIQD